MKKLIFSTLLVSSTLLVLEIPVLSNPCPILNATEITVVDDAAKLRTDPRNTEQTVRDRNGSILRKPNGDNLQAVIYKGNNLKIDKKSKPKKVDRFCYYPVLLNHNTNPENINSLFNTTYWISKEKIKDFNQLISSNKTINEFGKLRDDIKNLRIEIKNLQSKNEGPASEIFYFLASLILILFIVAITVGFFLQKENFFKAYKFMIQLHKQTDELLKQSESRNNSNPSLCDENAQTDMLIIKTNPSLFDKNLLIHDQLSKLNQSNINIENNLKHIYYECNKSLQLMQNFIEKFEINLKSQKGFSLLQNEAVKSGKTYTELKINEPNNNTQNQQIKEHRLSLASFSSGETSDKFYKEVISKFNSFDKGWFNDKITSGQFQKVQLTKESAQGSSDSDGTTAKYVEIDEVRGTLLVYKAANGIWLIPNPIDPNWERVVSPSCFNVTNKNILVYPAEVKIGSANVWEVIRKGKFE